MSKINVLPAHLADLIAAGEVVERPASVVKELLENSIDAGATACTVEIRNGGLTYIRVTDNGCGMEPGDAKTAFLRHATSKIRTERDLEAIGTLGFRGEALAAIAAVARIELLTCPQGADTGTALELDGGRLLDDSEAGCPPGTTIIVRNLFYNTPARLKFLKRDQYEAAAVLSAIQRIALGYPNVSIKYLRDGVEELHTPGDSSLESCVYAVLGRDVALSLLPAKFEDEYVSVTGFVSSPRAGRGNRALEFFFVNGRSIRSNALSGALEAAFRNRLLVGKFPACVLNIGMKFAAVDVNVHPTKAEVRFFAESRVASAVHAAAKNALDAETNLAPGPEAGHALKEDAPSHGISGQEPAAISRQELRQAQMRINAEELRQERVSVPEATKSAAVHIPGPFPVCENGPDAIEPEFSLRSPSASYAESAAAAPLRDAPEEAAAEGGAVPEYRLIGEALDTYVIVQTGSSLVLIDKHAAHERKLFDALVGGYTQAMPQALMEPERFTPTPKAYQAIMENLEALRSCGFGIEDFGAGSLLIREAPAGLNPSEVVPLLEEIVLELKSFPGPNAPKSKPDDAMPEFRLAVLRSVACKAAIKAGKASETLELRPLIESVLSGEIKYCPHGRPVSVELTGSALNKLFKR
ncbi:MAG: DNA mismatch repair endonuclease MutL [Oscillospiraceae bacterium]|jgi:DNA mismatch repair protein MutL